MSRSSSPISHGGCSSDPDPEEPTEEQSPRAPSPSDDKLSRLWNRRKQIDQFYNNNITFKTFRKDAVHISVFHKSTT